MATKHRTINFYTLIKTEHDSKEESPAAYIRDVINYIQTLDNEQRCVDLTRQKFCYLHRITKTGNDKHTLIFKSAKSEYRPPLMNRKTVERENPKRMDEGDGEKTHLIIKYTKNDVFVVLEKNGNGVQINAIVKYLKRYTRAYLKAQKLKLTFSMDAYAMAKENFLVEVKKLKRVSIGEVYVEKSILGSDALNFSNRTQSIKHDIILKMSAERDNSILGPIEDMFNKMGSKGSRITKIRVTGKTKTGNEIVLDTKFIEKMEGVESELNALTGEVNTPVMLEALREIANPL